MASLYEVLTATLLVYFQTIVTNAEIKYELDFYTKQTIIHSKELITSTERTPSIKVLSDVTVLRKGMLEISAETYEFWIENRNLEKIEVGAFDNQNITYLISLESNKLTVIASGTFKNLKIRTLDLSLNKITRVEENAITDMPNLKEVFLSYNKIVKFNENSFVNTPKLWVLDVQYNEFAELSEKGFTFRKKDKAVILSFDHNNIEKIHAETFDGITVGSLDLSHNKLNQVPAEIFTGSLVELMLNNNTVEDLPDTFFQQKKLKEVDVSDNPLTCGTVQKLRKLAEENSMTIKYDRLNC
ncbi:hypothetical protein Zmor_022981 [Zophobas morio]|uniref:Uncharacterized protein n=1 Tax=Zophobas morio TaxID=2755281 RepID=A0AA38HX08_9CUCU|nr:hypothetical protein Zmor_022981 [Zophobas morio]